MACHSKKWVGSSRTIALLMAQIVAIPAIDAVAVAAETATLRAVAFSKGWIFHRHWLNELGTVVFSGSDVLPPSNFRDDSLVMVGSSGFIKFVSRGDAVPGKEGQLFVHLGFNSPALSLNDRDEVAFLAMFRPCDSRELLPQCEQQPDALSEGLFLYSGGRVQKIVTLGDTAPSDASLVFRNLSHPLLNNQGEVLFSATLAIPNRPSEPGQLGIFRFRNGGMEKIVAAGDATPLGGSFKFDVRDPRFGFSLWNGVLTMDEAGAILFSDRTSIGTDAVFHYSDTRRVGITTCGYVHVAYSTNIGGDALLGTYGSNTCPANSYYFWHRGGNLELNPSWSGMPTPVGGTFGGVFTGESPQLGGAGAVLFMSGVQEGSTSGGYFQYQPGSIKKLVTSEDPAPVYTGGDFEIIREERYGDYTVLVPPSTRFSVNEWNMLAFTSEVSGEPRLFGLFFLADESILPIALLGDRVPQASDQSIESLPTGWRGGAGEYDVEDRILLNNSGDILFHSRICCGSWDQGLFMASLFRLAVPNGSFELAGEGHYPSSWSTAWNNSGTGRIFRFEGGGATSFSGSNCLRLQVATGGGSIFVLSDPIAVNAEATYLLSSRLRYNLSDSPDRVYFTALQYDRQGNELGIDELQRREGDSFWDWRTERIKIYTGKDTAFMRIRFGLKSTDAAVLDVDAVR